MVTTLHSIHIRKTESSKYSEFHCRPVENTACLDAYGTVADSGCTQRLLISLADAISYPAMSQSRHVRITTFLQPVKNEHLASVLPAFQR